MDSLYSVKTQYTLEEYKKYTWTFLSKKRFVILFGIMLLLFAFFTFVTDNWFYIVFAIIYPLLTIWLQNRHIKKIYLSNKRIQNLDIMFDFYDTYFTEKTANGEERVEYNTLHKIVETKTNFYLMISKNQGYILKKSELPDGLENFVRNIKRGMKK